ncbi:lysozyme [Aliiruegeria haliotis]|uniref:Lysozyme n=1 Tax=Aliiruegeria haliotis TaxID=1280846 RepID=A0A2T0RRL9_9RHOB|nr:GH25 family lysozyme [Aliiruegeria haliotis]PRY23818.1 lysozyme [Aliiruegeria haliotis]
MRRLGLAASILLALAACGGGSGGSSSTGGDPVRTGGAGRDPARLYPDFADRDPHDWDGRAPRSYPVHGLDVSRWQKGINWTAAHRAGISFAFIKATEGVEELDPMFRTHWEAAAAAGVPRAGYHFFYFCAPADEQARWFIANVPPASGSLPHVLDMEWNPHSPTCTKRPDGAVVRAEARTFLDILERHYGRRPIIYTSIDFWEDTGIGRLPRTQFWLRSVADHPRERYPGQRWAFWQYTGTGVVPGVPGGVDINVFAGSAAAWATFSK